MTSSHHLVLIVLFVLIGGSVGSFLNVCAYRIPLGLSLLRPRSHCPRCRRAVGAYDNVPVMGWLMLRGRCRQCGGAISPRYPLVELLTGIDFAGAYLALVAAASGDVWEQNGALGVTLWLLLLWTVIALIEVLALICYDSIRPEQGHQFSLPGRGSGKRSEASSIGRVGAGAGD